MGSVTATAPGKVVLCGEYAVLDGAAAIAMAINRRASVTIDAGSSADVASLGLGGKTDTRLLDCVCEVLDIGRPDAGITLDTDDFADSASRGKLGIGSSAALAVALVRALGPPDAESGRVFEMALAAHRNFQDGRGSGIDVAVSIAGGLIEYRQDSPPRSISWPADLNYALLWSGVPASTSSSLATLAEQAAYASRDALREASNVVARLWCDGDAAALVDGYRDYIGTLMAFDVDHRLHIFDAGHDELARYRSDDTVYKPCGAGGGDVGIVLGVDPQGVSRFADYAGSRGFRRLDLVMDGQGAVVTRGGR